MNKFKINNYITLKLENGKSFIYIKGIKFLQCIRLVLQIPKKDFSKFEQIDSIDEAKEHYKTLYQNRVYEDNQKVSISPEEEFWGHCSNIQTWAELNYDTRIIHSNIAFPLLKRLTEEGDSVAKRVFREEIAKRLMSGEPSVSWFLIIQGYVDFLEQNEINIVFLNYNQKLRDLIIRNIEKGKILFVALLLIKLISIGDKLAEEIFKKSFKTFCRDERLDKVNKKLAYLIFLLKILNELIKFNDIDVFNDNYFRRELYFVDTFKEYISYLKNYNFSKIENLEYIIYSDSLYDLAELSGWNNELHIISQEIIRAIKDIVKEFNLKIHNKGINRNLIKKEDLYDIFLNQKEEIKKLYVKNLKLDSKSIQYKIPYVELTGFQKELFLKISSIDKTLESKKKLNNFEKANFLKEKEQLSEELLLDLKKPNKIKKN